MKALFDYRYDPTQRDRAQPSLVWCETDTED